MSQGKNAVEAGNVFENFVESLAVRGGFTPISERENKNNTDMFARRLLLKNVTFPTLWGTRGRFEFVLIDDALKLRIPIECKWQDVNGSTDQKIFATFLNLQSLSEQEVILLIDGPGFSKGAAARMVNEVREMAEKHNRIRMRPKIHIMNMNEFQSWFLRTFIKVAA